MRAIHWSILAVLIIVAAGVRVYHSTRSPLSIDELGTMEIAAGRGQAHLDLPRNVPLATTPLLTRLADGGSIWQVPAGMRRDVHPPIYFLALRIWMDLFGDSDAAARAMSILAGIFGVLLVFDLGRMLRNPATGLWAAAIMAVAQPQIVESQDARPYALAVAFSLAAWDFLIRIEQQGKTRWRLIGLGLTVLASALTHYYTAGLLVAMVIYASLRVRKSLPAIGVATIAGILIWGRGFYVQTTQSDFGGSWMYWFNDQGPDHFRQTFQRLAALPIRFLAEPMGGGLAATGAAVLYILPFLLWRRRGLLLCGLWLVCTVGLVGGLDLFRQTRQLDWVKYTLMAGPAVYLMLPMLLKSPHLLGALGVICAAIALPDAQHESEIPWKTLAADVNTIPAGDELLIYPASFGDWYGGTLFIGMQRYADHLPGTLKIVDRQGLQQELDRPMDFWLLSAGNATPPEISQIGRSEERIHQYQGMAMLRQVVGHPPPR